MQLDQIQSNPAAKHFTGLDGMRGAAALLVFLSHASASQQHILGVNLEGTGKFGVTMFFILSAHLLTLQFLQKNDAASWGIAGLKHYFIRRFMRIYPLYTVFLTTALITTWLSEVVLKMKNPDGVPLTLDFIGVVEHLILTRGDGITWSIAVEFKYYFILPLVSYVTYRLANRELLFQFSVMTVAIAVAVMIWPPSNLDGNDTDLRYYLGIFLTGSLCGLLGNHWHGFPAYKHKCLSILLIVAVSFIAFTSFPVVRALKIMNPETHEPEKWMFVHGIAIVPVLFAAAYGHGITNRIFSMRILRFIGMISFSLYLWHPVFIRGGERLLKEWNPYFVGWIALFGSITASYVSYLLFEKPFLKLCTIARTLPNQKSDPRID